MATKRFRGLLWLLGAALGMQPPLQPQQPPPVVLSSFELDYVVELLNRFSMPSLPGTVLKTIEASTVKELSLTQNELDAIRTIAREYRTAMTQLRQAGSALVAGKSVLSQSDVAQLSQLNATRDQQNSALGARLVAAVRPETLARLRVVTKNLQDTIRQRHGGR